MEAVALADLGQRSVTWQVNIDADPEPKLTLKHEGMEVSNSRKITIEKNLTEKKVFVTIKNVSLEDIGNYTLVAQVGGRKKEAYYQLDIKSEYRNECI